MNKPKTNRDIENVEAWAEIIADILHHVPPDKRASTPCRLLRYFKVDVEPRRKADLHFEAL
jgi:hypothetical protein